MKLVFGLVTLALCVTQKAFSTPSSDQWKGAVETEEKVAAKAVAAHHSKKLTNMAAAVGGAAYASATNGVMGPPAATNCDRNCTIACRKLHNEGTRCSFDAFNPWVSYVTHLAGIHSAICLSCMRDGSWGVM